MDDLDQLVRLARGVMAASVCGLGSMAPNPVLVALEHYRDEFEAHINEKKCPAGVCRLAEREMQNEECRMKSVEIGTERTWRRLRAAGATRHRRGRTAEGDCTRQTRNSEQLRATSCN